MKARHEFKHDEEWYEYLRVYFSGQAMQGLLSNPTLLQTLKNISPAGRHESMAETALLAADTLIAELNKEVTV